MMFDVFLIKQETLSIRQNNNYDTKLKTIIQLEFKHHHV
jgi:hypothetical protein